MNDQTMIAMHQARKILLVLIHLSGKLPSSEASGVRRSVVKIAEAMTDKVIKELNL